MHRATFPEVPPRVEYALTEKGLRARADHRLDAHLRRASGSARAARAPRRPEPVARVSDRPDALTAIARCSGRRASACGESAAHAQPGAARLTRRLRPGGRLAARRGGLGRRRDPVRARRDADAQRPAVLLPAADRALHRPARRHARPPAVLPGRRAGLRALPDLARLPAAPRPPRARGDRARSPTPRCRRSSARCGPTPPTSSSTRARFARRLRRARGRRLRGLRAVGRAHAGRGARDRVRRGAARRRASARARRRRSPTRRAGLPDDPHATVAVLALESSGDGRALEAAGRRLRRLQTALRLWDDAEPALGPTA